MNRDIEFRGKRIDTGGWVYGLLPFRNVIRVFTTHTIENNDGKGTPSHYQTTDDFKVEKETVGQFTGIIDRAKAKIFEGDIVQWRKPYRTTQTHTGDNIPQGSYTEPMEPAIDTLDDHIVFKDGAFMTEDQAIKEDWSPTLHFLITDYNEQMLKEAIAIHRKGKDDWDEWADPDEGDLKYLCEEYKCKDLAELLDYCSGITVIGNIYDNPEMKR